MAGICLFQTNSWKSYSWSNVHTDVNILKHLNMSYLGHPYIDNVAHVLFKSAIMTGWNKLFLKLKKMCIAGPWPNQPWFSALQVSTYCPEYPIENNLRRRRCVRPAQRKQMHAHQDEPPLALQPAGSRSGHQEVLPLFIAKSGCTFNARFTKSSLLFTFMREITWHFHHANRYPK